MSQPESFTLSVDVTHTSTPVDQDWSLLDRVGNRSLYLAESHLPTAKDTLNFYRTFPKPTSVFNGVQKSAFKFSTDKVVTGADGVSQIVAPLIIEVSFSIPVGVDAAALLAGRQRVVALINSDTMMDDLNLIGHI